MRTSGDRLTVVVAAFSLCAANVAGAAVAHAAGVPAPPLQWTVVTLAPPGGGTTSFAEPGIAVAPDGTALIDAATANTGAPPTFWSSTDAGTTWTPGKDVDSSAESTGDADVAIGADGYRYALTLAYSTGSPGPSSNPTILVYRSSDGTQWQGPASFPVPHGIDQPDRPWVVVDPRHPANVDVVNSEVGGNVVLWRSSDHGASFTGPVPVTGGANSQAALALGSRPLFDPSTDGRLFMLYETPAVTGAPVVQLGVPPYEFPMTQLWLAESPDAGASWTNQLVLDAGAATTSLPQPGTLAHLLVASAVDRSGNLFAAFSLRASGATQTRIYLIRSTDHGSTWSAAAPVTSPMASNVMPALAVDAAGTAYLSWYGSAASDFSAADAQWVEMVGVVTNALSAQPTINAGQLPGTGTVHLGGIDTAGALAFDAGANWGLRDFQSIAVDGCGRPHPVWAVDDGAQLTQTAVASLPCQPEGTPPSAVPETPWVPALSVLGAGVLLTAAARRRARQRSA